MNKRIIMFVCSTLLIACSAPTHKDESVDLLTFTDEVDEISSYIERLEVIPLQTDSVIIVSPVKTIVSESSFLFLDGGMVNKFDRQGHFQTTIGRIGRGPGEYIHVVDFCMSDKGDEYLLLTHQNQVLRFSSLDGSFLGQINTVLPGVTASGIIPLKGGNFALYIPNPPTELLSDFSNPFYCVRYYNSRGKELGADLLREDFRMPMSFQLPTMQMGGNRFTLAPSASSGPVYVGEGGRLKQLISINFGSKSLPARFAFRNGKDPWEAMDEIGMSDYYKYPASACMFDQYFYCSAYGKDFEVWNYIVNMDAEHKGIRWKSVPNSSKPMWAVAADTQRLFYYCSETELEDGDSSKDPVIRIVSRYMDQNGIPKNNPIIFGVVFNLRPNEQ